MATDELTAILNQENIALKEALAVAVSNHEAWHAVSSWAIKHNKPAIIGRVLDETAIAARIRG